MNEQMTKTELRKLEKLVKTNCLTSFSLVTVDENGVANRTGKNRNTERLTLKFPDGETLVIETFCSGCAENTCLCIS